MPRIPKPREGELLKVNKRPVNFSFWPTKQADRRQKLQPNLQTTNPWAVITTEVEISCPKTSKPAALAFLRQAEDYYKAATIADLYSAKPVLYYYSFLNIAKSFILTKKVNSNLDNARHGLQEIARSTSLWTSAGVKLYASSSTNVNIADEFYKALFNNTLSTKTYQLNKLLPQIIQGHRLWCHVRNKKERFIPVDVEIFKNSDELWLNIYVDRNDLARLRVGHLEMLRKTHLANLYKQVLLARSERVVDKAGKILFEQKAPIIFSLHPTQKLLELVETIQFHLWEVVLIMPPYRKYYLYMAPSHRFVLPQLISMYMIMFFFGSVTRYRPHEFEKILRGKYGAFIREIIGVVPQQFLYLMASEFLEREVNRAALV